MVLMFRCFLPQRRVRVISYTTLGLSQIPQPTLQHRHHLFEPLVPSCPIIPSISSTSSFVVIPLQALLDKYKASRSPLTAQPSQSSHVASDIEKSEFLASRYQYSSCLEDAQELHLSVFKSGFTNDLFLCNTLINIYVRINDLDSARKVFDEMRERNSITWSCLVSGYTQNSMPDEACDVFRRMICDGLLPNRYAFASAIRACQECGNLFGLRFGMQIHGLMLKTQYATEVTVCNVLISMYGSCLNTTDYAHRVFDEIGMQNLISWNIIISVYSRRGDAVSAFGLFSRMQKDGYKPNEYTLGSLIASACCSDLSLLKQMLTRVEKSGFSHDLYVGSAMVSGFAKFGLITHAKNILKQMSNGNAVSVNGLIIGLVRQKLGEEAFEVFREMKDLIELNLDSYVVLFSAFPEFVILEEGKRKGKEVHACMITTGLIDAKLGIKNGLLNMYAKCGAIEDACLVFKLMNDKDSVSWNSMITGLDQNELFEDAILSFKDMKRTGLMPSNFTMISALSSCASLEWITLGKQMHSEGIKLGHDLHVSVSNALLALYSESGYLNECQKVFALMPNHDRVSWNSLIGALADSEASVSEAVRYFQEMIRAGWDPNRVTFISILAAVSSLTLELGEQIHTLIIKHNVMPDSAIENALIACYGKCGKMSECENIFSRMSSRKDEVSWNSMISSYIHNEDLPKGMDLVWFMMQRGQRLDGFTFATVLSACATVATLERGMEVHACSIRACLESDVVVGSAIVDMYSKCGRIDYASKFFEMMPLKNVYSWNSMISGYARHGHGKTALNVFTEMKLSGGVPDHVTFVGVLSACSHVGLVNEGFNHFKSMSKDFKLAPRMEHFSCMVDLLGRAGELNKVEEFINNMPIKPNSLIWRTVLGACCRVNGRETELGKRAARILLELEPKNGVNFVLLSNMYAFDGKWEDMAKARTEMRKAAVKKEAGYSWVTMKDGVHVFLAGDKSHPEKDLIYEKLKEINWKMREMGYVPETKFALHDLEVENKEEVLSHHSEKIAVAFVLTRKSEMPIRIMKNLRVCGDCHSAFKYVSKIVGRQIVLRDSNRFHHFDGGECSCGDYW